MGILKYGTREYTPNKTQLFKRRTVAVSAYDWRDDMSLMLLQQKLLRLLQVYERQVKINSTSSANKK
jgi:hypothetical protein